MWFGDLGEQRSLNLWMKRGSEDFLDLGTRSLRRDRDALLRLRRWWNERGSSLNDCRGDLGGGPFLNQYLSRRSGQGAEPGKTFQPIDALRQQPHLTQCLVAGSSALGRLVPRTSEKIHVWDAGTL